METREYAPGRSVDLYGDPGLPTVLLWHGMQTDSRAAVRTLAGKIAEHGYLVVAPDWNSHAADGGRDDLLRSARFAGEQAGDQPLTVVGWSMGGLAAAGLTLDAQRHGIRLHRTVCLAGAFMAADPLSGARLAEAAPAGEPVPVLLLHGTGDDVVPAAASSDFAAVLRDRGWPVDYVALDADHGNIAGARYDAAADRYEAADDPATLAVATEVAARITASDPAGR